MQLVRWVGLILMAVGVVTGSVMGYMRFVVVSTPIYQAPGVLDPGGGNFTTDQQTATVFTVLIVVCVLVFLVGVVAFIGAGAHADNSRSGGKPRPKRRKKLPWNPPRGDSNV